MLVLTRVSTTLISSTSVVIGGAGSSKSRFRLLRRRVERGLEESREHTERDLDD